VKLVTVKQQNRKREWTDLTVFMILNNDKIQSDVLYDGSPVIPVVAFRTRPQHSFIYVYKLHTANYGWNWVAPKSIQQIEDGLFTVKE
jgi:hypothetical protein